MWDGDIANPADTLSATELRPQLVMTFGAHLLCASDTADSSGAIGLKKFAWSKVGDPTDFSDSTAGSAYAYEGSGGIQAIAMLTRDTIAVYKSESVHLVDYVGAPMYFSFRTSLSGVGVDARDAVVSIGNEHIVLTNNGLRKFNGATLEPFGQEIEPLLSQYYPNNNYQFAQIVNDTYNNKLWVFLPSSGNDWRFTSALVYSFKDSSWSHQDGFDAYAICLMRLGTQTDTFRLALADVISKVYVQDVYATTRHGAAYTSRVETAMVSPSFPLFQVPGYNTELVQLDVGFGTGTPDVYIGVSNAGDDNITWHGPYTPNASGTIYTTIVGRWFTFRVESDEDFSFHTLTPWYVRRGVL
jgi:hypothetical protein